MVSAGPAVTPLAALAAGVDVADEPELARALVERLERPFEGIHVSVTELVAPRPAYWRRVGPVVPIAPARAERLRRGAEWHRRLAERLPREGAFEVRIRRDGVSGRIDVWSGFPVEVKTVSATGTEPGAADRVEEVEQLGLYCALTGTTEGRLVHLRSAGTGLAGVDVVDVEFASPAALREDLAARVAVLRAAMSPGGSPASLPRCPWLERGCDLRSAGICGCTGNEPELPSSADERVVRRAPRPETASRWAGALAGPSARPGPAGLDRFREALYLRRAYFDRASVAPEEIDQPPREIALTPSLYERLVDAVEGGPIGEVAALGPGPGGPAEEVVGWQDQPYLVRTSRAWERWRPEDAARRMPQYAAELGFRAWASGRSAGRVVLAYERAERPEDRLQVLRYRFPDPGRFGLEWAARERALEQAIAHGEPGALPACPDWMARDCPYRDVCGCGSPGPRSQR